VVGAEGLTLRHAVAPPSMRLPRWWRGKRPAWPWRKGGN